MCYDYEGNEVRRLPLPGATTLYGTGASPIVAGDLVLVNVDYPPSPCLVALDGATGRLVWRQVRAPLFEGYATSSKQSTGLSW